MIAFVVAALALSQLDAAPAWDYKSNGRDWSGIGQCGNPGQQSPIDLPVSAPTAEEDLMMFLKYPEFRSSATIYHNGNSIALTMPENFRAGFGLGKGSDTPKDFQSEDADAYRLWQVNFHSPSEHTINGERMPLEMQMMHQQVTGGEGLAVVVVLFSAQPNAYGALLDAIIGKGLPRKPWEEAFRKPSFAFAPVVGGSDFYSYEGSLTVPPCERRVKYFVRKETIPAAHAQLEQFSKVLQETCAPNGNYRTTQALSNPVSLVGTVDLITAPDKKVRPRKANLPEEKAALAASMAAHSGCAPEELEKQHKNKHRFTVADSEEVTDAKAKFRSAEMNWQAAQRNSHNTNRSLHETQKLYDASTGVVDKINIKWKIFATEQQLKAAEKNVELAKTVYDKEEKARDVVILKDCVARQNAHAAAQTKKQKAQREKADKAKAKAKRHFNYHPPNVKLPGGLGGSPFSNKQPDGTDIVTSDKIAVNLRQPDAPASSSIDEATPTDGVGKGGWPEMILTMRLPVAFANSTSASFQGELVKALAESAHVDEDRLEVREVHKADIQQVKNSRPITGPITGLVEELGASGSAAAHEALPRRALRHGRL